MKRNTYKKPLSLLLALAMALGLMPALTMPAGAADIEIEIAVNESYAMHAEELFSSEYYDNAMYSKGFTQPTDGEHQGHLYEDGGLEFDYDTIDTEYLWYMSFGGSNITFRATDAGIYTFTCMVNDDNEMQGGGRVLNRTVQITVSGGNTAPTDITLDPAEIAENAASGTVIGSLSTTDADVGDSHTYTLVSGAGDADNASFSISESELKTSAVFDFESKSSYSIRIRSTDSEEATYDKSFTITVTDAYEALSVTANTVLTLFEDASPATVTGSHLSTWVNAGLTATYTVTTPPSKGMLKNNGVALGTDGTFTQADVGAGKITYTPAADANGADSFDFSVSDGTNDTTGTFAITITAVNDAPTMTPAAPALSATNEDTTSDDIAVSD
ncbi:MAG TPA: cadherin-like domain-containing protein, partial [Terriglobales bacterium]|nr:cadherin-like domain-containing protein [Terriglobales bacterium]